MNVNTIVVDVAEAEAKYEAYRKLPAALKHESDYILQKVWKAATEGKPIVNVVEAFRSTGVNDLGQPKLAIARANWAHVRCWTHRAFSRDGYWSEGGAVFTIDTQWFNGDAHARDYAVPAGTFEEGKLKRADLRSAVPHMPPDVRPRNNHANYHILFEVERWEEYPVDPFLLRRVAGDLFVVLAEWELTPLEASILGAAGR